MSSTHHRHSTFGGGGEKEKQKQGLDFFLMRFFLVFLPSNA